MEPDKSENKDESKKCGHHCRCGGKVVAAIALVLLGWIAGFLMGQGRLCGKSMMSCPMSSIQDPQTPPKK